MTETIMVDGTMSRQRREWVTIKDGYAEVRLPILTDEHVVIALDMPVILKGSLVVGEIEIFDPCSLALAKEYRQNRPFIDTFIAREGLVEHPQAHPSPTLWVKNAFRCQKGMAGIHRVRAGTVDIEGPVKMVRLPREVPNPLPRNQTFSQHESELTGDTHIKLDGASIEVDHIITKEFLKVKNGNVNAETLWATHGMIEVAGNVIASQAITAGGDIRVGDNLASPRVAAGTLPNSEPGIIRCHRLVGCFQMFGTLKEGYKEMAA